MNSSWHDILFASLWSRNLPPTVREEINASARSEFLERGTETNRQGEPFAGLVCLLSGEMHVIGTARHGDELLIGIHRPGDWTGFLAALDRQAYALSLRAVTDCRIARIDAEATTRIFERDLDRFKLLLAPELSVSRGAYRYFVETSYRSPMLRLADRMIALGRWPYSLNDGDPSRLGTVSQADLANSTRLSRQTINAGLGRLAEQGVVRIGYRSIEVLDLYRLSLIATGELDIDQPLADCRSPDNPDQ